MELDSNAQPLSWQTNTRPFSQTCHIFLKGWVLVYELSECVFTPSCSHLKQMRFVKKRRINTWKVMFFKHSFLCPTYNLVIRWQNINRRYTAWCIFFISWSTSTNKRTSRVIWIFSLMYRFYIDTSTKRGYRFRSSSITSH